MKLKMSLVALATFALASGASALTYEVLIENMIPGGADTGQPFSPPVAVVHDAGYALFVPGGMATPGLILVAEEGDPSVLQAEASSDANTSLVIVGTGPFFDSQILMIEGEPGDLFSVAWMLGRTNDLFSGVHDIALPASGSVQFETTVWDAGSEVNTGMIADIGFYGNPFTGPDENNNIMTISMYTVFDDPNHGQLTWNFPPSGRVTIRVSSPSPVETSSWGAIKALYQ